MILALDTSAAVSAALLTPKGTVVGARHAYDPRKHAELLSPFIDEVIDQAGAEIGDVTRIIVGQGPGPFTGLRVALVTARVLAYTLQVPLHGLPSLDGLALAAAHRLKPLAGREMIVATDARRREVYWARYGFEDDWPVRLSEPAVDAPAEVPVDGLTCVGRGALLYPDVLPPASDLEAGVLDPSAADLGILGLRELARGVPDRDPEALYLRRPDATPPQHGR